MFGTVNRTDCPSLSGHASMAIALATPPIAGLCQPDRASGEVMKDHFSVICQGFVDDDLPLTYTFYVEIEGTGELGEHGIFNKEIVVV